MNSDSPGKAKTRLVKKVVFLFVLALVALAYVATPVLAAGGCNNGGNDNGNGNGNGNVGAGGNNKKAKNPVSANSKQETKEINDLKAGTKAGEKLTNPAGDPIELSDLGKKIKPGDSFNISFSDGVKLKAVLDLGAKTATVTLTDCTQQTCAPQPDGTAIVTPKNGASDSPAVANSDKQTITQLRKSSLSGKLQLFRTNSTTPIKLSALQRVGQKFKIKIKGNFLNAVYRGNNQASVTLLSGQKIIISLVQDSIS